MAGSSRLDQYPSITGKLETSFAYFTIRNRLPYILHKIIEENNYVGDERSGLEDLRNNILYGKVEFLPVNGAKIAKWEKWLRPFIGKTWYELPFYFAEAYFYSMILDRINYFMDEIDPFLKTKRKDILDNSDQFSLILRNLRKYFQKEKDRSLRLNYLLHLCLWGNKSDLSQIELNRTESGNLQAGYTLIDDAERICNVFSTKCERVDIILDNSGIELFTDLVLANQLISLGFAKTVVLHAKQLPTFVSDATIEDIRQLCDFLRNQHDHETQEFAVLIEDYLKSSRIIIKDHSFWNAPLHFYEMPLTLYLELEKSDMIVFKGDANYRRIFGDKELPLSLKTEDLAHYLPTNSMTIRILKSEIITGLSTHEISEVNHFEQDWLISGKYGLIQLIKV